MKKSIHPARVFLAAIFSLSFALPASGNAIVVGTGADASYAVFEAVEFGSPRIYEFRYNYDALNPLDAYAMLTAIDAEDSALSLSFINFGTEQSPSYFLDAVTLGSLKLENTDFPTIGPFWAQWVSGGEAGFIDIEPVAAGVWNFGSGISAPFRAIGPGSWDGFIFNLGVTAPETNPVAPVGVPESASSIWLLLIGITGVLWMVPRRDHEHTRA
ncbi:MAG TPA: hypothetical protein VIT23_01845 [Terrimicrobiaceae bacterium]